MGNTRRKGGKEQEHKATVSYKKMAREKKKLEPAESKPVVSTGNVNLSGVPGNQIGSGYIPGVTPIQKPDMKLPAKQPHQSRTTRGNTTRTITPRVSVLDVNELKATMTNPESLAGCVGLELGTIKHFNSDPAKPFGFVTTDLPNENGKPELFFHIRGGCEFVPVGKDKIEMIFIPYTPGVPSTLTQPLMGDRVVFMRGHGAQGEKAVKLGNLSELQECIDECSDFNLPTYRLVKEVKSVGNRVSNCHTLWEGDNLGELVKKYPMVREAKVKVGLSQSGEGTTKVYFTKLIDTTPINVDKETGKVSGGKSVWEKCEDPRVDYLRRC